MDGKLKFAERACIALLIALGLLLAVSFLPIGGEKAAAKEKTILLQQLQSQLQSLDELPPAVGGKIEPAVKDDIKEALYMASAAKTKKEGEEKKKVEVLVKASSDDARREIKLAGGEILNAVDSVDRTARYFAVRVDADRVAEIASDEKIASVAQRGEFYPTLDSSVPVIKADSFWNAGYKGNAVRVAVLDTGIDKTHPMLNGKVAAERDFTSSGNTDDQCSHGTHVAGIVAGSKANGGAYDGVAPDAQLLSAKVLTLSASGKCGGKVDYIIAAIGWALDPDENPATSDGAKIISMSIGGMGDTSASLEGELKAAAAKGAVIVVSSGNCGSGCPDILSCGSFRGVTWPGNSPSVITVGAVDDSKNAACFSSGENVQNVGIKPDFAAPGVDVTSSVPGSGYESKKGTSMAAPHVSGAVALLLGKSPGLNQGDVVRIFEKTATDLGDVGKDTSYGFGLIDMAKALAYKEGLEVSIELEKQIISGSAQKITVRVYDDVTVNSVKAAITKPNNAKTDVTFTSSGGNIYAYDYSDTALMGNYVVDVAVNYGGTGGSSGTGSETGGEAGSGTGEGSSITVTRTAYFKATSLTGDFGNVEEINVSEQQLLSSNLTGTITFANTAGFELNFSALLQLLDNGTLAQEIRLQPVTVAANSKASVSVNSALDANPGNYTLRILTDYGAGSLVNETNITVTDDLAPQIVKVDYSNAIKVNDAQTIIVEVNEHQKVQAELQLSQLTDTGNCSSEQTVVSDDFNDNSIDQAIWKSNGWTDGAMTESGGNLYFETGSSSDQQVRTLANVGAYDNFTLTVRMKIDYVNPDKNSGFWLGNLAEGQPSGSTGHRGYYWQFHGATKGFNIGVWYDDKGKGLHDKYSPPNWEQGKWHDLKVERIDGVTRFYFDGALVGADSTYAPLLDGLYWNTGRTWKDPREGEEARMHVDDFRVVTSGTGCKSQNNAALAKLINANYTTKLVSSFDSRKTIAITIFNGSDITGQDALNEGSGYVATLQLCDESGNCYGKLGSGKKDTEFSITGCSGKRVLVAKAYDSASLFEEAAASAGSLCTSVINKSITGTPPASYLEKFDAVVWTTGTDLVSIDSSDAAALADYYGKKGKVAVEGSDVAFRHGSDDFIREVLHSELKTDLGFTVTSAANMSSLNINATRQHPIIYGLASPLPFNATIDPFPDAVQPYNGGVELAAWSGLETKGSAIIAYESEDGTKKSLLLPFSIAALNDSDAKAIASNTLEWLLEESSVDISSEAIGYRVPVPKIYPPGPRVCITMCVPMWGLSSGGCTFNECGSGCGADNVVTFSTKEACELVREGKSALPQVEGQPFGLVAHVASTDFMPNFPAVEMLVDGAAVAVNSTYRASGSEAAYLAVVSLNAGVHTVRAVANSDFSIVESSYANNIRDFNLTVYPKLPDLALSGLAYEYDDAKGAITVNLSASNFGGTAAASSVKVYMYGKEAALQAIELSAGETKQLAIEIPSGKGAYLFKAVIDPDSAVAEHNESNNELAETIYLCSKQKVLVVNDNDAAFFSTPEPGSSDEFLDILRKDGYCVEVWDEKEKGVPGSSELGKFKAVVWSAGDYFNGTISNEDAMAISNFSGGLLIEGSDVGLDSADSGFLQGIAAATFSSDMLLNDTQNESLALKQHAITANITGVSISKEKSPYPDAIDAVSGEVVAEWQNGKAAITANAGGSRKVAYYAFSVDGVTDAAVMERLVLNSVQWLLPKPNRAPVIINISGNLSVNEGEAAIIRVEAKDADSEGAGNLSVAVNDSRFAKDVQDKEFPWQQYAECGGFVGKPCPDKPYKQTCVTPYCMDCFGLCHIDAESLIEFFSWKTSAATGDAGTYLVNVTVSDGKLNSSALIEITVKNVNEPPEVTVIEDDAEKGLMPAAIKITMKEGETKNFSIIATDPDNDTLSYRWLLNGSLVSATYYFAFSPRYNESGSYNLTVIASDGQAEARAELLITVLDTMECEPATKQPCALQLGVCSGSNETCGSKGKWPGCTAAAYLSYSSKYEVTETSCDGLDNDCDGLTDEGFGDIDKDNISDCVDTDWDNDGVKDDEDDLIGKGDDIDIKGEDKNVKIEIEEDKNDKGDSKGRKTKHVRINNSGKPLIEFDFNFRKGNILLHNISVEKQNKSGDKGFTLVRGLDLKGKTKQVFVDRLINGSNAVCIKDSEVSQISEVNGSCSSQNENLLQCDFPKTGPPYARTGWTCGGGGSSGGGGGGGGESGNAEDCEPLYCQYIKETQQYRIFGLKHSAVLEQCTDADMDSYLPTGCSGGSDCNDNNASVSPAAAEVCNGADDNCNGQIDENRVCNTAPILQSIGNRTVSENSTLTFAVAATDSEGDSLTFSATNLPQGAAFSDATAAFAWTPTFEQSGAYAAAFNVSDGLASDYEKINITVTNVNRQPRFENITNQTVAENSTLKFFANATDPDNDTLQFTVEVPPAMAAAEFNSSKMEFSWKPSFEDSGSYSITFKANDSQYTAAAKANITVLNVNRAPQIMLVLIDPPDLVMGEGETKTFAVDIDDADNDAVAVAWEVNGEIASTEPQLEFSTIYNSSGEYSITLAVSDYETTATTSMLLTVQDTLQCETGQTMMCPLQLGVCQGSFVPCDQGHWPACSYYHSYAAERGQVFIGQEAFCSMDANVNSCILLCDNLDNDCDGEADEARVCNTAPILQSIGNKTVSENSTLTFTLSASDNQSDSLTFNATGVPEGASFDNGSATLAWTPDFRQAGAYVMAFSANDGLLYGYGSINVTVENVNRHPLLGQLANRTVNENETLRFTVTASDPDNESLTITVTSEPAAPGLALSGSTGEVAWTPNFEQAGDYRVTFTVSDGLQNDSEAVNITVGNVNRAPSVKILLQPPGSAVSEGGFKLLKADASDPDGDRLNYSWLLPDSKEDKSQIHMFRPNLTDGDNGKVHRFTLYVTDGQATAVDSVEIEVSDTQACQAGSTESAPCGVSAGICRQGTKERVCGYYQSYYTQWGEWGECVGEVRPAAEDCGTWDDDNCDGEVNEGCGELDLSPAWMAYKVYDYHAFPNTSEISEQSLSNASPTMRILYYGEITNRGKSDSPPYYIAWFLNGRIMYTKSLLGRINASQSIPVSMMTYVLYEGENLAQLVVDLGNKITESDESNNELSFPVSVKYNATYAEQAKSYAESYYSRFPKKEDCKNYGGC